MPSARGCFFSFTFSASLVSFASLSFPLPQNCPFVQGSSIAHSGNINTAWFAARMATHHNSANLAGGVVFPARKGELSPPDAQNRVGKNSPDRSPLYDFFNRNSPILESPLTHRKQTPGLFLIRNKKAFSHNYSAGGFYFSYPSKAALRLVSSLPRCAQNPKRPRLLSATPHRVRLVQVTLFAQLTESYRPRRQTLLGWFSTPRRIG